MKKLSLYFVLTAILSFALGYYLRGAISMQPTIDAPESTKPGQAAPLLTGADRGPAQGSEVPEEQHGSRQDEATRVATTDEGPEVQTVEVESSKSPGSLRHIPGLRDQIAKNKMDRMSEFFSIYGIGPDQASSLVQALVDIDLEQTDAMSALGLQDLRENPDASDEDRRVAEEALKVLNEDADRDRRALLGEHYDAYVEYRRTYSERTLLNQFSDSLSEPLYSSTRDELFQIIVEETERPERPADHYTRLKPSKEETMSHKQAEIDATKTSNERIKARARAYLSEEQYKALSETLDTEVERLEARLKLSQLSPGR